MLTKFFVVQLLIEFLVSANVFTEIIGQVVVVQKKCIVVPPQILKSVQQLSANRSAAESRSVVDVAATWLKTSTGIEEISTDDWILTNNEICFNSSTILSLEKIVDAGKFSADKLEFRFLEFPHFWVSSIFSEKLLNLDLDQCQSIKMSLWKCPEEAIRKNCTMENLEETCADTRLVTMRSEDHMFTHVRKIGTASLAVATRVNHATTIENGNIFAINVVNLPHRTFQLKIPSNTMMSIGNVILKNV